MSPKTLESWTKHGGKVPDNPLLEDTFAFGLSLLEMGNLLSLKNIRLNKEKELLYQQLSIFGKRYPKIKDIISNLLWNVSKRKTFS